MDNQPSPNTEAIESWFMLMTEAMRRSQDAQKTFESLMQMAADPAQFTRWLTIFAPEMAASVSPETVQAWLEEWQRTLGVVPRTRYLELLEKHAQLQQRLEQAEATIRTLRSLLAGQDVQQETAQQVMDTWGQMLESTLQMQSEWLRQWAGRDEVNTSEGSGDSQNSE